MSQVCDAFSKSYNSYNDINNLIKDKIKNRRSGDEKYVGLTLLEYKTLINSNKEILSRANIKKIYRDYIAGKKYYSSIKSQEDFFNYLNSKDSNENEESQKQDKKDIVEESNNSEEQKIDYLQDYFKYNSLYKQRFKDWFRNNISIISRINGNSFVVSDEVLNESIRKWQQQLVKNILSIFNDTSGLQTEIYQDNGTEDNGIESFVSQGKIKTVMKNILNILASTKQEYKIAYYSYIALTNFDQCMSDITNGEIKPLQPGVSFNYTKIKYTRGYGENVITGWRDDSKDYDQGKELSKSAMNIITSIPLMIDGVQHGNIEWNQFLQTFNAIRNLQFTYVNNTAFEGIVTRVKQQHGLVTRYRNLNQLLSRAKRNGIDEYHDLFKILKYHGNSFGLSTTDVQYISAIYDYVFDDQQHIDGTPNSFYYIFKNSSFEDKTNDRNFYYDIIQMFNSTEELQLQGYRYNQDGELISYNLVNTKRDQYVSSIQNYINSTLNSQVAIQSGLKDIIPGLTFTDNFDTNDSVKQIGISFTEGSDTYSIIYKYDTSQVSSQKANKLEIQKNDKEVDLGDINSNNDNIRSLLYKNVIDPILSIRSNNRFLELQQNSNFDNLQLVSHIVYNYLVSYKINKDNPDLSLDQFKSELSNYYKVVNDESDKAPQFNTDKQISIFSIGQKSLRGKDFPTFKKLIEDYVLSLGIGKDTTVRDGENNSINTVSLSQRISKLKQIHYNLGITSDDALKPIDFINYFYDVQFMRDFKGKDGNVKKAVEFNFGEFFAATFLLDYLDQYLNSESKSFAVFGDVISDKGKIDLLQINKSKKINGKEITKATVDDIKIHIQSTIGGFYRSMLNNIKSDMDVLSNINISKLDIVKELGLENISYIKFNVLNNYKEINELRNSEGKLLTRGDKEKLLHALVGEVLKTNPDFKLTQYSQYVFIGDKMVMNPAIIHNALLYSQDTKALDMGVSKWNELFYEDGKDNYFTDKNCNIDDFLVRKHQQLIQDLLQNNVITRLTQNNRASDKLKKYKGNWYHHGKMIYAKIIDQNNPKQKLDITEISDLRSWFDYKFLLQYSKQDITDQFMYLVQLNEQLYQSLVNNTYIVKNKSNSKQENLDAIRNYIININNKNRNNHAIEQQLLDNSDIKGLNSNLLFNQEQAKFFDISNPDFKFGNVLEATSNLSIIQKQDYFRNTINSFLRNRIYQDSQRLKVAEDIYQSANKRNEFIIKFAQKNWNRISKDTPTNMSEEDVNTAKQKTTEYQKIFSQQLGDKQISESQVQAIYSYIQNLNQNQNSFTKAYIGNTYSNLFEDINLNSYDTALINYNQILDRADTNTKAKYIQETKSLYDKEIQTVETTDNKGNKTRNEQYVIKTVKTSDGKNKAVLKTLQRSNFSLEVHPELIKYNMFSHDFGEQYQIESAGAYTVNPSKTLINGNRNIELIEAQMYGQRTKRNVLETASKHQYQRGLLNGIPHNIKIMAIDDIKSPVYNIMGETNKTTDWDGATFVNPFMDVLENNSLGGNRAGTDKKQFASYVNKRTGEGLILKTAGFVLTNARIRDCSQLRRNGDTVEVVDGYYGIMMKDMTDTVKFSDLLRQHVNSNGELIIDGKIASNYYQPNIKNSNKGYYIDFLSQGQVTEISNGEYQENKIDYKPIYIYDTKSKRWIERKLIGFNQDGEIEYTDNILDKSRDVISSTTKSEFIDSVYQLWKLFGGEYSGHLDKNSNILTYVNDNTSVQNVVTAMNNVGIRLNGKSNIESQDDIYQIIKDAQICYSATVGSLKLSQYNVNSQDMFTNTNYKPNYFTIDTADIGIQLNAEHDISGSILSIMTQVVNALGARGYSERMASPVYKTLEIIARNNMKGLLSGINHNMSQEELSKFRDAIADIVINSIKRTSSTDGNIMVALAQTLTAYNDGKINGFDKLAGKFPFSDPAIFNKLVSNIASSITKSSISIKFPGSLSVMVPSNGLVKIYNGHTAGYYKNHIDELLKLKDSKTKLSLYQTEMETSYRVYDSNNKDVTGEVALLYANDRHKVNYNTNYKSITMDPDSYYAIKEYLNDENRQDYYLKEDLVAGRELRNSNYLFKTVDGSWHNIWDLKTVRELWDLNKDLRSDSEEHKDKESIRNNIKQKREELQSQLNALGSGKEHTIYLDGINGPFLVDKKSVQVKPYELIMGKVYQDEFGLEEGIELQDVNTEYFLTKILNTYTKKVLLNDAKYDIALNKANGDTILLKYKEKPQSNIYSKYINGKLYRVNDYGEKLYAIPSPEIEIHREGKKEIIYTNNLEYFIEKIKPVSIELSVTSDQENDIIPRFKNVIRALSESQNEIANNLAQKFLDRWGDIDQTTDQDISQGIKVYSKYKSDISSNATILKSKIMHNTIEQLSKDREFWNRFKFFEDDINTARELNTSFQESLKFIATRTPAQSHQSFMAMKVVGFDNSGKNSAYVSRWQIWLQGSDYDIDKVSLLGRTISSSGKLETWSPLQNLKSTKVWDAGEQIEFPTGKLTQKLDQKEFNSYASNIIPQNTKSKDSNNIISQLNIYNPIIKNRLTLSDYDAQKLLSDSEYESIKEYYNSDGKGFTVSYKSFKKDNSGEYQEQDIPEININQTGDNISDYDLSLMLISIFKDTLATDKNIKFLLSNSQTKEQIASILSNLNIEYTEDNNNLNIEYKNYKNITSDKIFYSIIKAADNTLSLPRNVKYSELLQNARSSKQLYRIANTISRKSSNIKILSDIVKIYNIFNAIPEIANNTVLQDYSKLIDYHNMYFNNDLDGEIKASQNFIASQMYNIMISPDNLIQASTSIDDPTNIIKDIIKEPGFDRLSGQINNFDPGTVTSKLLQIQLTLSGKANTANAASAMKKFEAMSAAQNRILNTYGENYHALISDLKILGKELKLLANTYVNDDSMLPDDVKQALKNVDQHTDAFVQLSAILSLSTDNAKDPTLSKINCGPDMLGLYTAGIMAGLDIKTLVKLMLSDTGLLLQDVMRGNVITGDLGIQRVSQAISFLQRGPVDKLSKNKNVYNYIHDAYSLFYLRNAESVFSLQLGIVGNGAYYKLKQAREFIQFIQRGASNSIKSKSKARDFINSITVGTVLKSIKKDLNYQINKLNKKEYKQDKKRQERDHQVANYNGQIAKIDNILSSNNQTLQKSIINYEQNSLEDFVDKNLLTYKTIANKLFNNIKFTDIEKNILYDIIDSEKRFLAAQYTIKNNTIEQDGVQYPIIKELDKLSKFNDETMKVNKVCKLNQGLPTNLQEFLQLVNDIENILKTKKFGLVASAKTDNSLKEFMEYNAKFWDENVTHKLDLVEFANNKEYRQKAIAAYDTVKDYNNVLSTWHGNDHYLGYLLCLGMVQKVFKTSMSQYREMEYGYNQIIKGEYANESTAVKLKAIKNLGTYLFMQRNNTFMANSINDFKINSYFYDSDGNLSEQKEDIQIKLGTKNGNINFKLWMDNEVFPWLRKNHKNNNFVQNLTRITYSYNLGENNSVNFATKAKTQFNNMQEQEIFQQAKLGLKGLQGIKYDSTLNMSVADLIFLYNIIAYNSSYGKDNFTNLFEDIIAEGHNSLIKKYVQYISQNDFNNSKINLSEQQQDEILRVISPKVYSVYSLQGLSTPYAYVLNDSGKFVLVVNKKFLSKKQQKQDKQLARMPEEARDAYQDAQDEIRQALQGLQEASEEAMISEGLVEDIEYFGRTKLSFKEKLNLSNYQLPGIEQSTSTKYLYYQDAGIVSTGTENNIFIQINPNKFTGIIYSDINSFIDENKNVSLQQLINSGQVRISMDNIIMNQIPQDITLNYNNQSLYSFNNDGSVSIDADQLYTIIKNKNEVYEILKNCNI